MSQNITLVWFRRDLRISDNPVLTSITKGSLVLPIFIFDPFFFSWDEVSKGRTTFMYQSLHSLEKQCESVGLKLHFFHGNSANVIISLIQKLSQQYSVTLRFNSDVQIGYGIERDESVLNFCSHNNINVESQFSHYYNQSSDLKDWNKGYYEYMGRPALGVEKLQGIVIRSQDKLSSLQEISQIYSDYFDHTNVLFEGGSEHGNRKLQEFFESGSKGYHWKMSRPYFATLGHSSHIAPHLTFGTLSVREVYKKTNDYIAWLKENPSDYDKHIFSLRSFRERLRWRVSFTNKLIIRPSIADTNKYFEFDEIYPWPYELSSEKKLWYDKWCEGRTGFALIDASMRQLKQHGWMNFRMRAMNATFLTVICGISWQFGARHFMQHLVDGDIAIDSWQWQMQAGITNPFSNTFRIYNPTKNIIEKDPDLEYIKKFVPELQSVSLEQLLDHQKNEMGILGTQIDGYPQPMLDIEEQRERNGKLISEARKKVRQRLSDQLKLLHE